MRFVGIFNIIIGALYCLLIIGAVVGVPMIIMGVRLRESADGFTAYMNSNDTASLQHALERQSRFFFIQKVFAIIAIIGFAIYILVIFAVVISESSRF